MAMGMDERWVNRSAEMMFETFHWFRGEGFNFIIDDLVRLAGEADTPGLPSAPGVVIVEGFRLLPQLVKPLLVVPPRAVWLLPTPEFREAVVASRGGSSWGFLAKTSDPETALRNLLERDRMFTDILREKTSRLGLPIIEVDISTTEDDLTKQVMNVFVL